MGGRFFLTTAPEHSVIPSNANVIPPALSPNLSGIEHSMSRDVCQIVARCVSVCHADRARGAKWRAHAMIGKLPFLVKELATGDI